MTDETTTEQLAEIEGQTEPVQVREGRWKTRGGHYVCVEAMSGDDFASIAYGYTWRGCNTPELQWNDNGLREIDSGEQGPMDLVEYLGPIEQQPQPQPSPQPQPRPAEYTPPEGWRVLAVGEVLQAGDMWVWPTDDQLRQTVHIGAVVGANQRYIRPIEPQPQPQPESDTELQAQVAFLKGREVTLGTRLQQEKEVTTRLRGELESVQNLLGSEKRRVAQLEDLVGSLRTINEAQEKAFEAADQHNSDLQSRLNAVCSEWSQQAETIRRLQIELDAAQQVPADSPELRQLRADLAEVTQDRDTYRDGYERVLSDLKTIKETTKAETVEAILEWLEPVRATIEAADNVQQTMRADNLACDIIRNLPGILRYVVGLNHPEEIE